MKTTGTLFAICLFAFFIFSEQLYSQSTVALIVEDENNLSEREDATENMLQKINYNVMLINYNEASYNNLNDYLFTVAVDDGAISKQVIDQLIENDNGVILLYDAGKPIGGTWNYGSLGRHNLLIENGILFLDGYQSTFGFSMQSGGYGYFIGSNYPGGWSILGRNTYFAPTYGKTVFTREHASGGRGVILTYDPRYFTGAAENIFLMALEWIGKEPPIPGVTVPPGNVAFVIVGSDDVTPVLTNLEEDLKNRLELFGYNVTYIRFGRLKNSDLSDSKFTIGVHYPSLDSRTVDNLLSNGKGVMMLRAAGSSIGGTWDSGSSASYHNLLIDNGIEFLNGYESTISFSMQYEDHAFSISDNYPGGWSVLGRNTRHHNQKTIFTREHASGGRGVILTYGPRYFTGAAENIFLMALEWIGKEPPIPGVTVPPGNVAFVIQGSDDVTPVLTDHEIAANHLLEKFGFSITYIQFSRLKNSDLSDSKFTIGVHYPSLDSRTVDNLLSNGKGVMMLRAAGSSIGGTWDSGSSASYHNLLIDNSVALLDGYGSTVSFPMQTNEITFYMGSNYPFGWSILGRNTRHYNQKTIFTREHASGGRGVILTYDPRYFTGAAENIFLMALEWIGKEPPIPGVTVPPGNVAFVIQGSDDITPLLTDSENAVRQLLEWMDYSVTYIRSGRLKNSDLLGSNFIIGTQFPTIDFNTIEHLLSNDKNVVLLHTAGSALGGSWGVADRTDVRDIVIENNEAYLDEYTIGSTYNIQRESHAYYIVEDYPITWSRIGRNSWIDNYKTAFYKSSQGKGALLTYNPRYFNEEGEDLLQKIIQWVTLDVEEPTVPVLISPKNNATNIDLPITLSWEASDNAESYLLHLSSDDNFSELIIDESNITTTSFEVSNLDGNVLYYWRVRAVNEGIASDWSDVWNFSTGDVTSVLTELDIPKKHLLFQNYPNPFNPSTVISYGIPERVHTRLSIFNMMGQEIATLVNEVREAGYYEAMFDASSLPSGVYIYRLQAGEYVKSRKMLFLR